MDKFLIGVIVVLIGFAGFMVVNSFYGVMTFKKDIIKFESRCTAKGGLTLQAYKTGSEWVGCYKDGVELENEQ